MSIPKLLRTKPPVTYRWLRRRRNFSYAVLIVCVAVFLPVGVVGGVKVSQMVQTNQAMAATRAMMPEHQVNDVMSKKERAQYAGVLSGLVIDDPSMLYQLIGNDFRVMFDDPDLQRKEGEMVVWQYRTDACVLDVFFDGTGQALHYEVRHRKIASMGAENRHEKDYEDVSCLKSLYKERSA